MPYQAKTFSPRKPRSSTLSTNIQSTRSREIGRSRTGWDIAKTRINTKYRTRKTRARDKLRKQKNWSELSVIEQQAMENVVSKELAV
jgi:hypothetical protein